MKQLLSLLFILLALTSRGQHKIIKNIVFEGAGIRGIAYSGAIKELENNAVLQGVQRVGGTSAGAITALLLSLGYSADEITGIITNTSFKKFNDGKFFFIGGINRFQKYYGWYKGRQFDKWLAKIIAAKTNNAGITFAQLHEKGLKDLYITGTCLNKQSLVVFSYENYPNMKVKDAVRISMSIPLYFEAVFLDASGNVIHHPKNKTGLDVMIDGGFTANFPIKIFDSTKYFDCTKPNEFAANEQTIGFRIDRDEQIKNDTEEKGLAAMEITNINDYFGAFYNIILENLNRQTLTKKDWQRTISISDGAIGPKIRKLSIDEIETLIANGATASRKYLLK